MHAPSPLHAAPTPPPPDEVDDDADDDAVADEVAPDDTAAADADDDADDAGEVEAAAAALEDAPAPLDTAAADDDATALAEAALDEDDASGAPPLLDVFSVVPPPVDDDAPVPPGVPLHAPTAPTPRNAQTITCPRMRHSRKRCGADVTRSRPCPRRRIHHVARLARGRDVPIFPRAMVRANNPPRVPALASHETVVHGFTRVAARLLQGAWRFSKIGLMLTAAMIAPIFLPPPPPPKPRDPQAQTDPDDKDKDEN